MAPWNFRFTRLSGMLAGNQGLVSWNLISTRLNLNRVVRIINKFLPHNVVNRVDFVSYFHPTFIQCWQVNVFVKKCHGGSMFILITDSCGGRSERVPKECPYVIRGTVVCTLDFLMFSFVTTSCLKFFSETENSMG